MARILIGNIKGPKGDTGPQGEQGPVGPQGPQGPLPPLVNNALSTEAGVAALDAVMGKTLQDQITQVNSDLGDINGVNLATDCNNCGEIGKVAFNRTDINTLNTPYKAGFVGSSNSGTLMTYKNSNNFGMQMHFSSGGYMGRSYIMSRYLSNQVWGDWEAITPITTRQTGITTDFGLTLDVMKTNGVVNLTIYGRATSGALTEGEVTLLATLPEQFQPAYTMGWNCYVSQGGTYCPFLIRVDYDRKVYINVTANLENLGYINASYVYGCET